MVARFQIERKRTERGGSEKVATRLTLSLPPRLARGARVDLDGAERAGTIFRGGTAPREWVLVAATAFDPEYRAGPRSPPDRGPSRFARFPAPGGDAAAARGGAAPASQCPPFPPAALRHLADELRRWLLRRPWPHECVLSRAGKGCENPQLQRLRSRSLSTRFG